MTSPDWMVRSEGRVRLTVAVAVLDSTTMLDRETVAEVIAELVLAQAKYFSKVVFTDLVVSVMTMEAVALEEEDDGIVRPGSSNVKVSLAAMD